MPSRRALIIASIVFLVLGILLSLLPMYGSRRSESRMEEVSIRDVPKDFVLATNYLKLSTDAMVNASMGKPFSVPSNDDLDRLITRLKDYAMGINVGYGELAKVLMRASRAYLSMANASKYVIEILPDLSNVVAELREALRDLSMCRIDEALEIYRSIEKDLHNVRNNLSLASTNLLMVDEDALLSKGHRRILNRSLDTMLKLGESLASIEKLFQVIERDRSIVEAVCMGKNVDLNLVNRALEDLRNVEYRGSENLASEFYDAKQSLEDALLRIAMSYSTKTSGVQGHGAGYAVPSSDD